MHNISVKVTFPFRGDDENVEGNCFERWYFALIKKF